MDEPADERRGRGHQASTGQVDGTDVGVGLGMRERAEAGQREKSREDEFRFHL